MDSQLIPSSPSKSPFEDTQGTVYCSTYTKEHAHTNGMKRNEFQLKLLLWILLEAWSKGYRFQLATKIISAHMFDDLVFRYGEEYEEKYRLGHIAYTQSEQKPIHLTSLLSPKKNFGLPKCFFSYQKTKNRAPFLGRCIEDVTLFTNFAPKLPKNSPNFLVKVTQEDQVFRGQRYKLSAYAAKSLRDPLKKKLQMIMTELVQSFVGCILHPSKKGSMKEILSDYTPVLCLDVVDVCTKQFRPEFLSNSPSLSDGAKMFRSILEMALRQRPKCDGDLKSLVTKGRIKLQTFCQMSEKQRKDFLPWPSASGEEIQDFVDHLILTFGHTEKQLERIIQKKLAHKFSAEKADYVFHYLERHLASWCRQTTGHWLTNEDADNWMIVAKFRFATRYEADFEESDFIAAGGFGAVYKARNKVDNINYAIKKIIIRY